MSERCYIATRKGLFTLDRQNGTWSITSTNFLGDNCTLVTHDPRDNRLYAALDHGHFGNKLHASSDGGQTWDELAAPEYPEQPTDREPEMLKMAGKPWPWSLKLIWSVEPGGADQPGLLWCGTLPGGLFKSTDLGQSWQFVRSLWDEPGRLEWFGGGYDTPGIHAVRVDPRNSQHVRVGVSCGGVWFTEDGGDTWRVTAKGMRAEYMPPERAGDENIQDPHMLVQCKASPDALWVQHHNGIFKSTDGGANWTELTNAKPSVFGFAVAVHPNDPNMAWFVPAIKDEKRIPVDGKVVVTRTRDGGETFDILDRGLPNNHAYDLVFRHALDIDETGDRLAFGSTTGNVWLSENQGDSWTNIATNLPPVYCVRFVKG